MEARQLTGDQLADRLIQIMYQFRDRLHPVERDALQEAARRVKEHERLLCDVLPDLRARVDQAEGGT